MKYKDKSLPIKFQQYSAQYEWAHSPTTSQNTPVLVGKSSNSSSEIFSPPVPSFVSIADPSE